MDRAVRGLAGVADVDELQVGRVAARLRELLDGEAGPRLEAVGTCLGGRGGVGEVPADPVEADAAQPELRLGGRGRVPDQHDLPVRTDDVADVLGEASVEADVQRTPQVTVREVGRSARVEQRRTLVRAFHHVGQAQSARRLVLGQQLVRFTVALRVEREVRGPQRLTFGYDRDELVFGHGLQRVVGGPLLADRRLLLGRELLAAGRTGPVRGKDARRVGQGHQLVVEGVIETAGELVGRVAGRREQIRAADVADEERVAREDRIRHGVVGVLEHDDRDGLRRVPRRRPDLELDVAEREPPAIGELLDGEADGRPTP